MASTIDIESNNNNTSQTKTQGILLDQESLLEQQPQRPSSDPPIQLLKTVDYVNKETQEEYLERITEISTINTKKAINSNTTTLTRSIIMSFP